MTVLVIPTLWLSFRRRGAKGARINYGNSTVDRWGYGVTSALSPYHENRIALDINDPLENDVELKSTSTVAVPREAKSSLLILKQFRDNRQL